MKARTAFALVFLLAAAQLASAQQATAGAPQGRFSVFGGVGYNKQWDDESNLGRGFDLEAGVNYRLTSRISVEGVVDQIRHRRELLYYTISTDAQGFMTPVPYHSALTGSATYALAQLRYDFGDSGVRPYVAGGLGLMHYSGMTWAAVMPPSPETAAIPRTFQRNVFARSALVGVEVPATAHVSIAPYFAVMMANPGETATWLAFRGGARVGYRW